MGLTAIWVNVPTVTVSPNFHLGLQFSQAIDPTTLVGTDLRIRRETGQFMNPGNDDVDFYTTDNITFLVVFHASSLISATSGYLVRMPMNRIEYQDDDDNTQSGPDTTINTPEFEINPSFSITPTIIYSVSEGQVGTPATATATFLQPVSGVDISDFSVVNGTLGDLTVVSATEYQVGVTPIAGDGTLTLSFAEDGTYEGNTAASETLAYRAATPPPSSNPPTFTVPAANYEVNERADDSIDSTEFFTGHTSLAFRSGYSAPIWLTISGLNVVITDAPDVLEDTDFTVPLTATNSDGSVNGSITISVQQIDPAPVFGTPNRFDINEGSSSVFDLSGDLQNTESLAYQSGYTAPSWLTISGLTLVITDADQVSQDTDFDVLLAAESTKTAATAERTVTIRVRDVAVPPPPEPPPPEPKPEPPTITPTLPNDPTDLKVELTPTTALILWKSPNNGAALRGYEISYAEGASLGSTWIPTGSTSTRFLVKNLKRGDTTHLCRARYQRRRQWASEQSSNRIHANRFLA